MSKVLLAIAVTMLAGCGAQVGGTGSFATKQIISPYGVAPSVVGTGSVRSAVASRIVPQAVVVPEQVAVTRPVLTSTTVARNVPVTRLVPMTNVVQVPEVISRVVPVVDQVTVPRLSTVPVEQPVVYQQYCSPWIEQGMGYGGLGYGGLGGSDLNPYTRF